MAKYEGLYRDQSGDLVVAIIDDMEQPPIIPPSSGSFPDFRLTKEELLPDVGLIAK